MATLKMCTDITQAKVLVDILKLDTADMYYDRYGTPNVIDNIVTHENIKTDKYQHLIPCWSLAALLDILPKGKYKNVDLCFGGYQGDEYISEWFCCYEQQEPFIMEVCHADKSVDACIDMIIKLHELNLL